MLNVGAISSPAHAYLCSGLVHTFVIMAGVTVVATAHTLLESSGKVEVSGEVWTALFYVPPEEEIIGVMSGEQGVQVIWLPVPTDFCEKPSIQELLNCSVKICRSSVYLD